MTQYKTFLLLFFASLSFFIARHNTAINQQLLHLCFIGTMVIYVPALHPQLRMHSDTLRPGLPQKTVIGLAVLVMYYIFFYLEGIGGRLSNYLDAPSVAFIGYLIGTHFLSFTQKDHAKSCAILFILTFSYYLVGFEQATAISSALLYLVMLYVATTAFVSRFKTI
ncbi:hypothetical protein HYS00_05435 [Candidatus Microgenomates bacterium]|nr:hypothetical protein [Candidatus Microgenomates bacterium]